MPLQITARSSQPQALAADLIVLGVFAVSASSATPRGAGASAKSKRPGAAAGFGADFEAFDALLNGALGKAVAREEFTGKRDQTLGLSTLGLVKATRFVVMGLGDAGSVSDTDLRNFAAKAARSANSDKAASLTLVVPEAVAARLRPVAEGLELGAYRFTKYLTGDRKPKVSLDKVTIATSSKLDAKAKRGLDLGQRVGAAINITRDLGNEPPNVMTPAALANAAVSAVKGTGIKIKVFEFKEIIRRGMKLIQAVGQGSENEPRFVHMTYTPNGSAKAKRRVVFVGKGITFDTGGISIKPAAGMGEMKADMSGAGNMVGLMAAIAAVKPDVEVHAIMACAENMPDGKAYRPGDVWGSLDGRTVEIINTDAEGRLLLADALAYARDLKPDLLIDNATLTGACVVALGTGCSGFYATNDETANEFATAVKSAGESMWRMPLLEDLREQIKSDIADVKQTGDRYGGSITAALFLREFIGDTKNWVHADIAGPAFADRAAGWSPKGATGHGILTYLALLERTSG